MSVGFVKVHLGESIVNVSGSTAGPMNIASNVSGGVATISITLGNSHAAGKFYTGTTNPAGTTRLNYGGEFRATSLYQGGNRVANENHTHSQYAASSHNHNASAISAGTLNIARIPIGTSSSTVSRGNHTHSQYAASSHNHNASAISAGTLNISRIPTGTSSSTVSLGNHSHNQYVTKSNGFINSDFNCNNYQMKNMVVHTVTDANLPTSAIPGTLIFHKPPSGPQQLYLAVDL